MDNISLAKMAWPDPSDTEVEKGDRSALFDILADNAVLEFAIPPGTPISDQFQGKNSVINFYREIGPSLVGDGQTEAGLQFGSNENQVIILGSESYTVKKTGVRCASKEFCIVLDFKDGKITKILQIKDFTEFAEAYAR